MNTDARRQLLRSLGYTEAEYCFTTGAEAWDSPASGTLTFPEPAKVGSPFTMLGGAADLASNLMHIGNTAANVRAMLTGLYEAGDDTGWSNDGFFNVPDPSREDYGSPEWTDELFCALAKINAVYIKAESARSNAEVK